MKGLFILFGEAFRETKIASNKRVRDTPNSLFTQKLASESHNNLINSFKNINIDVCINTYTTKYEDILLSQYKNIIFKNFVNYQYIDNNDALNKTLKIIQKSINIENYEFTFICRLDILLKSNFIDIFDPSAKYITYPNVMSIANNKFENFCISDLFFFCPKKYYFILNYEKILCHHCIQNLYNLDLHITKDIDFYSNELYIANTAQQKNPLYKISGRDEGCEYNENLKYFFNKKELIISKKS